MAPSCLRDQQLRYVTLSFRARCDFTRDLGDDRRTCGRADLRSPLDSSQRAFSTLPPTLSVGAPRAAPELHLGAPPAPRAAGYATLASRSPQTNRGGAGQCWPESPGPKVEQEPRS